MGDGMKEIQKQAFTNVVECPTCGAPLKVTNLTQWVVRECSEDAEHYSHETRRANNPVVITDGLTGGYARDAAEAENFAMFLSDMTTVTFPPTTASITSSPPLDKQAMYQRFDDSINRRAVVLMKTQGMDEIKAQRVAWNEHGIFDHWLARQSASVRVNIND
jgi:hypothetical protein